MSFFLHLRSSSKMPCSHIRRVTSLLPDISGVRFISVSSMLLGSSKGQRSKPNAKSAQEALIYCSDLVKRKDYENYLATLLLPAEFQPRVLTTLAFNVEISTIRQKIKRDSGVTEIYRLQFWRDALNSLFGDVNGPVPRQPVVTALHAFGDSADLNLFQQLVAGRQETLGDKPYASVQALEKSSETIHGTLIRLIGSALSDADNDAFIRAANSMGKAAGVTTLIRAILPLLREGVVLLPTDILTIHGLTGDRVFNNKNPDALKIVIKDLLKVAEKHADDARSVTSSVPSVLRPALIVPGVRMDYIAKLLNKNGYNLFDFRLQQHHPLISWKLYWRKLRGVY